MLAVALGVQNILHSSPLHFLTYCFLVTIVVAVTAAFQTDVFMYCNTVGSLRYEKINLYLWLLSTKIVEYTLPTDNFK